MSTIDWIVLFLTLLLIVVYGIYKSRGIKNIDGYLVGDRQLPWYNVGLSVMATQASAITFLSAPGLAYSSGMSFAQFYFGLPLAMIVLCVTFVPIFHRLKVYTAYEFLEKRFGVQTRILTAGLFLIQRGISTGITIFAPSIILSSILHLDVTYTTLIIGSMVIVYTVWGGTKAVSYSQLLQMGIIFGALLTAGIMVVHLLPDNIGFVEALHIAGKSGKTNAIDWSLDLNNQYTVWTGLIGGFFLQLSYFGTDQSQVGRYLTGSSIRDSRMGLLMNGLLKVPMQFFILLIGVLVFSYYQFNTAPLFFNNVEVKKIENSAYAEAYGHIMDKHRQNGVEKQENIKTLVEALNCGDDQAIRVSRDRLQERIAQDQALRRDVEALLQRNNPDVELNDNNYIFLSFVTSSFPKGLVGLLIAVIFLASMGATASAINSLSSTTVVDMYKRFLHKKGSDQNYLNASRLFTLLWGIITLFVALFASKLGNLLEAVNILGSLFYGTILGIFLVAFYFRKIGGKPVFWSAILSEVVVFTVWKADIMAYLWLNLLGCCCVIAFSYVLQLLSGRSKVTSV
ncbi:SSS family transporter [Sphingobacterium allocomposti]|uniref:SSS family transporter n=1 Tax=Sphingobacterium allocomposti TaxID=415956 RepID=A0A5S5D6G2_9SPHI|nr:sodium:solute symporter [Sphingobacterium composti Yoo et al. 2007 non Ten et al. 2007]TYP90239.1 SSS family transporter [Sphingobacterium composti Yoo et al. 2007 non Ten et al. 2007]